MEAKDIHTGGTVYFASYRVIWPLKDYVPDVVTALVIGRHTDKPEAYLSWSGEWSSVKDWHEFGDLYATYAEAFEEAKRVAIRAHKKALNAAGEDCERRALLAETKAVELRAEAQELCQRANLVKGGDDGE